MLLSRSKGWLFYVMRKSERRSHKNPAKIRHDGEVTPLELAAIRAEADRQDQLRRDRESLFHAVAEKLSDVPYGYVLLAVKYCPDKWQLVRRWFARATTFDKRKFFSIVRIQPDDDEFEE